MLSIIQEQTGWNPVNITNILTLHDVLNTETFASLTLPSWLNDTLMNELRQTAAELAHLINSDEVVQKIVSSPLFNQIGTFIKSISSSIQSGDTSSSLNESESNDGEDDPIQPKVFILTTKQEKLLSFIVASKLNSSYLIYPSEGSCIAIEISKDASKGSYFNIVYKSGFNMSQDWQPLQSAYCEESDCPIAELEKLIKSHVSDTTDFGESLSNQPPVPAPVPAPKKPSPDHSALIYDKLDDLYPINEIPALKARSSSGEFVL